MNGWMGMGRRLPDGNVYVQTDDPIFGNATQSLMCNIACVRKGGPDSQRE